MNKLLKVPLLLIISISLTSCELLSSLNNSEEENINDSNSFDFGNSNNNTTPSTSTSNNETNKDDSPKQNDESNSILDNEEINNIDLIELDYRGLVDDSAFSNEISITISENISSNYNIEFSLENEEDYSFFQVLYANNALNIKALDSGRFTYLNIEYFLKGKSMVIKTKKIKLVSNTTGFSEIKDFDTNITKLGNYQINPSYYAEVATNNTNNSNIKDFHRLSSNNNKYDLVIPSKVKVNGVIKEVGSLLPYSSSTVRLFCRKIYFPETLFCLKSGSISDITCKGFAHFSESKHGFLFCYSSSIIRRISDSSSTSYFLYENDSRIFAGPDYYYFPYSLRAFSSSLTWDSSVTYSSWDWKTGYIDYTHSGFSEKRKEFANNNNCFSL